MCLWLAELAPLAQAILVQGQRLPQELIGWEWLRHHKAGDSQANATRYLT
jgi:hypothetical protein